MLGGKRPGEFENTSNGRAPGDLGDTAQVGGRPAMEERQPPQTIIERPRSTEPVGRPQMRPVEEAPGFVETLSYEAPSRVEQNSEAPAAEPGVEAPRPPREHGVEQGERRR